MAKPPSAIGKAKREAAFQRRLERGAKKLAAKHARAAHRISLNHQAVGGPSASEVSSTSDAHPNTNNPQKEHAA